MTTDFMSVTSSQWSDERSMVLHLILTTLAGETQLTIELQEYDRFCEFKNVVLEQVDAGIRIIGEAAWRNCQRLQIVHISQAQ